MSQTQVSFAAHSQRLVCPPPPASANGSVRSLAAPAEPGVGVGTSCRLVLADEEFRNCAFWWWRDDEDRRYFYIAVRVAVEACFGDYARELDGFAVVDDFGELVRVAL